MVNYLLWRRVHCPSVSDDSFANVIETVDKQGDIVKVQFKQIIAFYVAVEFCVNSLQINQH